MRSRSYLVVGLGITGLSVVAYLLRQNAEVTVTDSRAEPPQLTHLQSKFANVTTLLGEIQVPEYITHIILSPGIALATPVIADAIARGVTVLGDIELFAQNVDKPVLAITGSNGKSTTTTLLGEMAKACGSNVGVGGNLGVPALELLESKHDLYILELSSFQLETTNSLKLQVATVLNISPDHMDRYNDVAAYTNAKLRIYDNAQYAVVNRQDKLTYPHKFIQTNIVSFGLDAPIDANSYGVINHDGKAWLARGNVPLIACEDMALMGAHNVANALSALAMGELAGFSMEKMLETLRTFTGLPHRCEKIINVDNIVWVNDSKGTNVGATLAALEGLGTAIGGKWIIILGGVGKNADFTPLVAPIAKYCKAAILIGEDAPLLWDLLNNVLPCVRVNDLLQAVLIAKERACTNDGVLLSPACASLDMFDNYMHRGQVFTQHVLEEIGSKIPHAQAIAN